MQTIKSPQCAETSVEADCQRAIINYGTYVLLASIVLNKEMCHQIILKGRESALLRGRMIMILHWDGTLTSAFLKSVKAGKTNTDKKGGVTRVWIGTKLTGAPPYGNLRICDRFQRKSCCHSCWYKEQ